MTSEEKIKILELKVQALMDTLEKVCNDLNDENFDDKRPYFFIDYNEYNDK